MFQSYINKRNRSSRQLSIRRNRVHTVYLKNLSTTSQRIAVAMSHSLIIMRVAVAISGNHLILIERIVAPLNLTLLTNPQTFHQQQPARTLSVHRAEVTQDIPMYADVCNKASECRCHVKWHLLERCLCIVQRSKRSDSSLYPHVNLLRSLSLVHLNMLILTFFYLWSSKRQWVYKLHTDFWTRSDTTSIDSLRYWYVNSAGSWFSNWIE